jgi:kynureninase
VNDPDRSVPAGPDSATSAGSGSATPAGRDAAARGGPGGPATLTESRVRELRGQFPILSHANYLNSCSLGALSHRAEGRLAEFLHLWHTMGASAWYEHWLGRLDELRGRMERFFDAVEGEVALSPSTSVALASVSEAVDWIRRPRVVTTELDFPTLVYQFAAKPEVELVVLPSDDGITIDPRRFAEAVDERTAFLATSHVLFTTGFRQDLRQLGAIARDAGALSLIDGYQGAGQVEVHPGDEGIDIYTTGPLKWLCGGPGLAYLWVRRELAPTLEPRIASWFGVRDPFSFDPERFELRDDARRFEMGTPALAAVHTALGAQELLDEVGMPAIEARNRDLVDRLVHALEAEGFTLRIPKDRDARTAIVPVEHADPARAVRELAEAGVIVDQRPGMVRFSPHFYNTPREIDAAVAALVRTV